MQILLGICWITVFQNISGSWTQFLVAGVCLIFKIEIRREKWVKFLFFRCFVISLLLSDIWYSSLLSNGTDSLCYDEALLYCALICSLIFAKVTRGFRHSWLELLASQEISLSFFFFLLLLPSLPSFPPPTPLPWYLSLPLFTSSGVFSSSSFSYPRIPIPLLAFPPLPHFFRFYLLFYKNFVCYKKKRKKKKILQESSVLKPLAITKGYLGYIIIAPMLFNVSVYWRLFLYGLSDTSLFVCHECFFFSVKGC